MASASVESLVAQALKQSSDDKGYVSDESRHAIITELKKRNKTCFDCCARNPTWVSMTFSVFLCLTCSGKHRQKGVHISFVRSAEMDKFTVEQLVRLTIGGNAKAATFFKEHGIDIGHQLDYQSRPAQKYSSQLDTELRQYMGTKTPTIDLMDDVLPLQTIQQEHQENDVNEENEENEEKLEKSEIQSEEKMKSEEHDLLGDFSSTKTTPMQTFVQGGGKPLSGSLGERSAPASRNFGGRKLDIDFDFEAAEKAVQEAPVKSVSSKSIPTKANLRVPEKSAKGPLKVRENNIMQKDTPQSASSRFSNAKSISSATYFQPESTSHTPAQMSETLANQRSISSDAYFNKPGASPNSNVDTRNIQLDELKETAINSLNTLKATGTDMFNKAKNWLST